VAGRNPVDRVARPTSEPIGTRFDASVQMSRGQSSLVRSPQGFRYKDIVVTLQSCRHLLAEQRTVSIVVVLGEIPFEDTDVV